MVKKNFDRATQILLPALTILGFMLTSFRRPEIGLILNLSAQGFWLYSGWKAWKKAGQSGIFITSILITIVIFYGIINYWFL